MTTGSMTTSPPLVVPSEVSLVPRNAYQAIDAALMFVKNGETIENTATYYDTTDVVIQDSLVAPKQNYSKADPDLVNLYAHKGMDEPIHV